MKKRAFTLIELSIVLVIIGLLIGGSFKVLKVMRERAQTSRSQDDVKVAVEAVIGNSIQNANTLPSATFFNKNLSPVKNNQHPLFYTDDTNLESTDICSFTTTNLKVVTPSHTINDVAFVVASESSNHNMQTAIKDDGGGNFSVYTYKYETKVDDNTSPVNIVENYDDIVQWVTLGQLQKDLECSRKPFTFINRSLPSANVGDAYSATLYVENNVTDVTITCNEDNSNMGISFTDPSFGGTPTASGTDSWQCTASEASPGTRSITKQYVITINPVTGGSASSGPSGGGPSGGGPGGGGPGGGGFPFPF